MNNLQIFNNPEFGEIRTIQKDGEPWFVGKDVATALGYEKPTNAVRKRVDEEDKGVSKMETPQGSQEMTIINESGLYCLIFSSKLEKAREFKRWVTHEVLPSMRKTGGLEQEDVPEGIASGSCQAHRYHPPRHVRHGQHSGRGSRYGAERVHQLECTCAVCAGEDIPEQLSLYDLPALQG